MASNSVKREFVADWNSKIAESDKLLDRLWFESDLLVTKEKDGKNETGVYQLAIECSDQEYCASLINSYLGFVSARSSEAVSVELVKLLEADKQRVENQLKTAMRMHNQSIKDRVTKLDSQIAVARSMGWELPNEAILASDKPVQSHYQGYKLLEAQKASLLSQIDNPAFASGIRSQEERIRKIDGAAERLSELSKGIQVIGVLDYAYPIDDVVAPKSGLIVVMALILGGMLGIFAVFIRHGIHSYQARQAEASKELA
jgi:LPS O-antigen subunit length determinant protein (WzzB/FepE family)